MENENLEVEGIEKDTTDYKALYEEQVSKVSELEWLIVKHKKEKKVEVKTDKTEWLSQEALEKMLEERDFYKANPSLTEYKDKISEYTSKWISFEKAVKLLEMDDETIINRRNTQRSNFTSWEAGETTTYTQEAVSKMPIDQAKKLWALRKEGKVKII